MARFGAALLGVLGVAATLAASSGALAYVPSGDTCSVTGTGTTYTVVINIGANSPEQGGFAIGAPGGVKITAINVAESSGGGGTSQGGRPLTTNLPANTSAGWVLGNPAAVPGSSITAGLTTSGPTTGSFTIVPTNTTATTWFDPVVCQHPIGTAVPSNKFTAKKTATFDSKSQTWRTMVTVPGPGTLNYVHKTLAAGGTPKPLVKSGRVSASKAGQVALILRLTPAGTSALASSGAVKLSLNIQFSPKGGKPANKVVTLTLKK